MTLRAGAQGKTPIASVGLGSPSRGRSVAGAVAPLSVHVHSAVGAALAAGSRIPDFGWLGAGSSRDHVHVSDVAARKAWALVTVTIIDCLRTGKAPSVSCALAWFEGKPQSGEDADWSGVESPLAALAKSVHLEELLPYLLDVYGRTSRLDVIRDESRRTNRTARKEIGSFYTPSDVADFMVSTIADGNGGAGPLTWYDPACGSGIFLLAVLRTPAIATMSPQALIAFATTRLLGNDISAQACDFAAFTILQRLVAIDAAIPAETWVTLRSNMICANALAMAHGRGSAIASIFKREVGALRLVCNPPYTSGGGPSGDGAALAEDGSAVRSLYLPFVEMAWRIAGGPSDASVLVVPLAFAANRTADHRRCRSALAAAGGNWTLLFYDRQPHALFGEDAKIRASIIIRRPGPVPSVVASSGLLKWTSHQRRSIFSEVRSTPLGQQDISRLIPKLGSQVEAALYRELTRYRLRRAAGPRVEKASPGEIVGAALSNDVFVGGTAYNFLNVFRNYPDRLSWRGTLSASGIHALRCKDAEEAEVLTAVLASRVAFWMWHVECDGFHVPAWFLQELSLVDLELPDLKRRALARLGREIWEGVQADILTSLNRGKVTFAFRPTHIASQRSEVDRFLLSMFGFGEDAVQALAAFEHRVVSIDGSRRIARSAPGVAGPGNQQGGVL